jgi:hypothetical protein
MERLVVQIRECMVYQSPPEMGALYSEVFAMRDVIAAEQDKSKEESGCRNMATKAKGASSSRKTSVSNGDYPLPPIFVASDSVHKQDWESVVGWIACLCSCNIVVTNSWA